MNNCSDILAIPSAFGKNENVLHIDKKKSVSVLFTDTKKVRWFWQSSAVLHEVEAYRFQIM
jgi:hypothetical protein